MNPHTECADPFTAPFFRIAQNGQTLVSSPSYLMTTAEEILQELKLLGRESYKRALMKNHGVHEPCFGVAIGDMKPIQKRIKKDYQLALDLYETGNYDAMYLAGLIADDGRMTREDLQRWVEKADAGSLPGTTVASVAAGSPHGWELAVEWRQSPTPHVAVAGWATVSCLMSVKPDDELDIPALKALLEQVRQTIHQQPDAVRYQMNHFIIAAGCFVKPLTELALKTAEMIGLVTANLGNNNCQIFYAPDYIRKVESRGALGKKRKSAKC